MTTTPRIGALFAGYGGLEMAAQSVLGGTVAWTSDNHPSAIATLAHHHPDAPNYGDITRIGLDYSDEEWAAMQRRADEDPDYDMPSPDWAAVEPVDVLCAGFPCQDISNAGKRAGIEGERSGLWSHVADAVRVLRPRHVVLENVSALLVRGLDRVAADLAEIGYDLRWTCLRAADVGAPHRRERWFGYAHPAHAHGLGPVRGGQARGRRDGSADHRGAAADTAGDGRHEGRPEPARQLGGPDAALGGARIAADANCSGWGTGEHDGCPGQSDVAWGSYEPAIRRWESVLGRPAPEPTVPGRRANRVLNPVFVEWLMGLPAGHVTGVPGLSRNDQLRLLGNGVVPQQGAAALRVLLGPAASAAA